jgi:metal-responsive CopG/Arc/MetJ family transcriptional regulator
MQNVNNTTVAAKARHHRTRGLTVSIPTALLERFDQRLKNRYAARSEVVTRLIEMFLDGKIIVAKPQKVF